MLTRGLTRLCRPSSTMRVVDTRCVVPVVAVVAAASVRHTTLCAVRSASFAASRALLAPVVPFKLADIGEGIAEVEVLEWFVKVGDKVSQFDKLCEVQSDKATVEITSKFDGIITKLHTPKGSMAAVGQPLVDIDVVGAVPQTASHSSSHASPSTSTPSSSTSSSSSSTSSSSSSSSVSHASAPVASTVVKKARHEILTTPAVRRLARENDVDLAIVPGTGKDGRILKEDMLAYIASPHSAAAAAPAAPAPSTTSPSSKVQAVGEWREPVRGVLRTMIKTMTAAAQVPHLGYCDEIHMDNLMAVRARLKPVAEKRGVPLSFMPFMIKAASLALRDYPMLNARLSPDGTELIHRGAHNIGFALATAEGLLVPNVKHVEQRSLFEIAAEVARIIEAGRTGRLPAADLTGGSLTLSNIGTVGGTYTSPILLLPEVVIGAFGKTQRLPRFDANDNVVPVNIMNVSWSADHRIVDGMTIASFSNAFKAMLEEPSTMLLDLK